jgi:hypothetical protein
LFNFFNLITGFDDLSPHRLNSLLIYRVLERLANRIEERSQSLACDEATVFKLALISELQQFFISQIVTNTLLV